MSLEDYLLVCGIFWASAGVAFLVWMLTDHWRIGRDIDDNRGDK